MNKELKKLYDKHGIQFNMALTHLMNVGWDNILEVKLDEVRKAAEKAEEEAKAKGYFMAMTVDFQVGLVELAQIIAKTVSPVETIQFCIEIEIFQTDSMRRDRLKTLLTNALYMALEENLIDYDPEQWMEHVTEYLGLDEDEYEEIMR